MPDRPTTLPQKFALLALSCFLVLAALGLAELSLRRFSDINFLDNSKGAFAPGRFGTSYGNTPNFEGISYGARFFIDSQGHRYDPRLESKAPAGSPAVLLLGDSVLFGPAVPEEATISGLLRRRFTMLQFYNAAVIGYDTFDYLNVASALVPEHPEIQVAYVVYCLNDLVPTSAQEIKSRLAAVPGVGPPKPSPLRIANDLLRSRSKLYLLLKNALRDTQMNYFESDLAQYREQQTLVGGLQPLVDLKGLLDLEGVRLKIMITPYEAQLRVGSPPETLLPQRRLAEFFERDGLEFQDMTPDFRAASGGDSKKLFLYGDPMHLNAEGHALVARILAEDLETGGLGRDREP